MMESFVYCSETHLTVTEANVINNSWTDRAIKSGHGNLSAIDLPAEHIYCTNKD